MISGAGDSQKALLTAMAAKGDSPSIIIVPSQRMYFDGKWICGSLRLIYICTIFPGGRNRIQRYFSGTERLRDRMKGLAGLLDGRGAAVIATVVEVAQKLSVRPVSLRI